MSFTTRSGRGRGQTQAQVTYHQSPRQQPNPLYQQFQPAYSVAQPSPPGASSPVTQQQQQQASPQQFKMQAQPVVKMEMATPVKPSVPQIPAVQSPVVISHQIAVPSQPQPMAESSDDIESASDIVKPWKKAKNPSFKVNKVLKRRRQNARFRKLLIPKNAIMVLNELQPGISFEAEEQTNAFSQLTYTVKIIIDGSTYTGEGSSKAAAKAAAAELAVKGLILKKIAESSTKKPTEEDEQMETTSGDDASEKGGSNGKRVIPEDEVPWGSLASFALFKLFADWKAQGTTIPPVMTPAIVKPIPKVAGPKPAAPTKGAMPENPELLHPVTLVGRLYPGTLFVELSREGNPPHLTFCMGATVNDIKYTGTAKSKKEAKKNCAIEILKGNNVPFNTTL